MPAKYPLQDLLRVRIVRSDKAQRELQKAQEQLAELKDRLVKAEKSYADYCIWRAEEEVRRYAAIMKKMVQKGDFDSLRYDLAQFKDEELRKAKQVEDAKIAVSAGEKAVEAARLAQQEAMKAHQKIEEHKAIWTREEQKRQEYLLDIVMEDVRLKSQSDESISDDYTEHVEFKEIQQLDEAI
jgi:hypothetical protein